MRVILTVSMVILLTTLAPAEELRNCPECHGTRQDRLTTKKIRFMEKVNFVHNTHYGRKNWKIDVEVFCTTCHQRQTPHFDVSKESCFLCHFKNNEFNEKLARCSLCHETPTGSLQEQEKGEHPEEGRITHKSLFEAKVPCKSCHLEVVKGSGNVNKDRCLYCHKPDKSIMGEANNKKLMHKEHVSTLKARCFDCHDPIEHKRADFIGITRKNCQACHPKHHIYQEMLLAGDVTTKVPKTPNLMFAAKTNCMGCHIETKHDRKGGEAVKGTGKACVACHTERHQSMLKEWKDKISNELEAVEEVRQKAEDALKNAQHKVPEEKLQQAKAMFEKSQEIVNIVRFGNGIHNKKYSVTLIDYAFSNFENIIDMLSDEKKIETTNE
jgi:hypothetical protein